MERLYLPLDHGMLFIFEKSQMTYFWMKNTPLPLDMIFIDQNKIIQKIEHNTIPHSKNIISSEKPCLYVLEINAGQSKNNNISVGDKIVIPVEN